MTENELLSELSNALRSDPLQPEEVTAVMLAKSLGLSRARAMERLRKLEKEGVLSSRITRSDSGHSIVAFKKI